MAKITARGATEVARHESEDNGRKAILVMCSDGRVLRRWVGLTGYSVLVTVKDPAKRNAEMLARIARHFGYA